jgi:hypothetical protein
MLMLPLGLSAQFWEIAARAGYLYPSSRLVREIFPKGWVEYQYEGSYYFSGPWSAWANVGYGYKKGHSLGLHEKTRLYLVPASIGAACSLPLTSDIYFRLGLGGSYSWLNTRNNNSFVRKHLNKESVGWVAKSNVHVYIWDNFFVDLFCDYNYSIFDFKGTDLCIERFDLDVSGLRAGLGFGMAF